MLVLFDFLTATLPKEPDKTDIWTDGDQILCKRKEQASALNDLIQLTDKETYQIGYYDPEDDRKKKDVDKFTGWYYLY